MNCTANADGKHQWVIILATNGTASFTKGAWCPDCGEIKKLHWYDGEPHNRDRYGYS